jgi:uncharacterized protein YndB with AHSA1/START domain
MDDTAEGDRRTTIERQSDREIVVTRRFDAPRHLVFQAWTQAGLFRRWWAPGSMGMTLVGCEMDARTGGGYRLDFRVGSEATVSFHGTYLEVTPPARLVWTNEEEEGGAVTTVTFEERGGTTLVVLSELYPTKEALEAGRGAEDALPEQFGQLDGLLAELREGGAG